MPKAELSELLFILIMFIVVIIISVVSIYLFVRQLNREKKAREAVQNKQKESNFENPETAAQPNIQPEEQRPEIE